MSHLLWNIVSIPVDVLVDQHGGTLSLLGIPHFVTILGLCPIVEMHFYYYE